MPRLRPCLHLLLAMLSLVVPPSAVAASASEAPADTRLTAQRAIELAERDPRIQARLALRDVEYEARARWVEDISNPISLEDSFDGWYVEWLDDGDWRLEAVVVDPGGDIVMVKGQQFQIMPEEESLLYGPMQRPAFLLVPCAAFVGLLLLGAGLTGGGWRLTLPLTGIVASHSLLVWNGFDRDGIRERSVVLFGLAALSLLLGGIAWWRASLDRRSSFMRPSGPLVLVASLGAIVASFAIQAWYLARHAQVMTDVGYASHAGADLLRGGLTPYGNMVDIPFFLVQGDTYGPIAYLAYTAAFWFTESVRGIVLGTNIALELVTGAMIAAAALRMGATRTAAVWACAVWCTCPVVIGGVLAGNNDVMVAACIALVALVIGSPALRGVAVALAVASKLLPVVLVPFLLRLLGESRRAIGAFVGAMLATSAVVWLIGLDGVSGLDAFIEGVEFQMERDDIASIWGLLGLGTARHAMLAIAAVLCIIAIRRMGRDSARGTLLGAAAALAFTMLGIAQWWGTYAAWVVPLLLVAWTADSKRAGAPAPPPVP